MEPQDADRAAPRETPQAAPACACGAPRANLTWDPYLARARCGACGRPVMPPALAAAIALASWAPPAAIDLCPREPANLVPHTRGPGG